MDVVGGTVALTVVWDVLYSAAVPVCGCAKEINSMRSIINVANANVPVGDQHVAVLRQYFVHKNG